jgi:hypothetical protein
MLMLKQKDFILFSNMWRIVVELNFGGTVLKFLFGVAIAADGYQLYLECGIHGTSRYGGHC